MKRRRRHRGREAELDSTYVASTTTAVGSITKASWLFDPAWQGNQIQGRKIRGGGVQGNNWTVDGEGLIYLFSGFLVVGTTLKFFLRSVRATALCWPEEIVQPSVRFIVPFFLLSFPFHQVFSRSV